MSQQHPPQSQAGFGSQPNNGPGFAPAGPTQGTGPPQHSGPSQPTGPPPFGHSPETPPSPGKPPRRSRLPLIIGAAILTVALLATGGVLLGRHFLAPDDTPANGKLPKERPIEAPDVIDEIAEKAGLTCHDEATSTVKIKGCYLHQPEHLVTLRYRITDDGAIDKVSATILRNNVTAEERNKELHILIDPLLPELPLAKADRAAIMQAMDDAESDVSGDTEWSSGGTGSFNYRFTKDTTTLNVGNRSADFMPAIPLTKDFSAIVDELTARDWMCDQDGVILTCTDKGRGKIVAGLSTSGQPDKKTPYLTGFRVWFNGLSPTPGEPRMKDAYAAIAKAEDKGKALSVGLRMLAEGEKHFFNSETEFYRGDSYYDLSGVQFN